MATPLKDDMERPHQPSDDTGQKQDIEPPTDDPMSWTCTFCNATMNIFYRDQHLNTRFHARNLRRAARKDDATIRVSKPGVPMWHCGVCGEGMSVFFQEEHLAGREHARMMRRKGVDGEGGGVLDVGLDGLAGEGENRYRRDSDTTHDPSIRTRSVMSSPTTTVSNTFYCTTCTDEFPLSEHGAHGSGGYTCHICRKRMHLDRLEAHLESHQQPESPPRQPESPPWQPESPPQQPEPRQQPEPSQDRPLSGVPEVHLESQHPEPRQHQRVPRQQRLELRQQPPKPPQQQPVSPTQQPESRQQQSEPPPQQPVPPQQQPQSSQHTQLSGVSEVPRTFHCDICGGEPPVHERSEHLSSAWKCHICDRNLHIDWRRSHLSHHTQHPNHPPQSPTNRTIAANRTTATTRTTTNNDATPTPHPTEPRTFFCTTCNTESPTKERHEHLSGPWKCHICNRDLHISWRTSHLSHHTQHPPLQPPTNRTTSTATTTATNRTTITTATTATTPTEPRTFHCPTCNTESPTKERPDHLSAAWKCHICFRDLHIAWRTAHLSHHAQHPEMLIISPAPTVSTPSPHGRRALLTLREPSGGQTVQGEQELMLADSPGALRGMGGCGGGEGRVGAGGGEGVGYGGVCRGCGGKEEGVKEEGWECGDCGVVEKGAGRYERLEGQDGGDGILGSTVVTEAEEKREIEGTAGEEVIPPPATVTPSEERREMEAVGDEDEEDIPSSATSTTSEEWEDEAQQEFEEVVIPDNEVITPPEDGIPAEHVVYRRSTQVYTPESDLSEDGFQNDDVEEPVTLRSTAVRIFEDTPPPEPQSAVRTYTPQPYSPEDSSQSDDPSEATFYCTLCDMAIHTVDEKSHKAGKEHIKRGKEMVERSEEPAEAGNSNVSIWECVVCNMRMPVNRKMHHELRPDHAYKEEVMQMVEMMEKLKIGGTRGTQGKGAAGHRYKYRPR